MLRVKAISINPVDAWTRQVPTLISSILQLNPGEGPIILGWDISGVVTEVGSFVTRFKKGDEVFGMINFTGHGQAYAVQIAKHLGAYVIGTSSAANKDFVLSLGADEHLDYAARPFEEVVTDADIVLDGMNTSEHIERSVKALKPGGSVISIVVLLDRNLRLARLARAKKAFLFRLGVESATGDDIDAVARLLESGAIRSHISTKYPFNDLPSAHTAIESGHTKGKIVVTLD